MLTTSEAFDQFLESLRSRRAPTNTIRSYAHDLRHFVQAVPGVLEKVTAPTIQRFHDDDGHHNPATRGWRYATLCTFYHWALSQGLIEDNPIDRLDPIVQPKREPRPLAPEAVSKISEGDSS